MRVLRRNRLGMLVRLLCRLICMQVSKFRLKCTRFYTLECGEIYYPVMCLFTVELWWGSIKAGWKPKVR